MSSKAKKAANLSASSGFHPPRKGEEDKPIIKPPSPKKRIAEPVAEADAVVLVPSRTASREPRETVDNVLAETVVKLEQSLSAQRHDLLTKAETEAEAALFAKNAASEEVWAAEQTIAQMSAHVSMRQQHHEVHLHETEQYARNFSS